MLANHAEFKKKIFKNNQNRWMATARALKELNCEA
jgi:hypothetical protein